MNEPAITLLASILGTGFGFLFVHFAAKLLERRARKLAEGKVGVGDIRSYLYMGNVYFAIVRRVEGPPGSRRVKFQIWRDDLPEPGDDAPIAMRLSQEELGKVVGASRQKLNPALKELAAEAGMEVPAADPRAAKKAEELERLIADENLHVDETHRFVANAFRDGAIPATGTAITKVLPPVSRFSSNNPHAEKKQRVLDKLTAFFERYFGLMA